MPKVMCFVGIMKYVLILLHHNPKTLYQFKDIWLKCLTFPWHASSTLSSPYWTYKEKLSPKQVCSWAYKNLLSSIFTNLWNCSHNQDSKTNYLSLTLWNFTICSQVSQIFSHNLWSCLSYPDPSSFEEY